MNTRIWLPWFNNEEDELIDHLRNNPIFSGLRHSDYQEIKQLCHRSNYNPGERIFSEGDPSSAIYLILKGNVKILKESSQEEMVKLAVVEEGDFFGELALCEGHSRTASAEAGESSVLLGIFRQELQDYIHRNTRAGLQILMNIIDVLGNHVMQSNKEIESLRNTIEKLRAESENKGSPDDE